MRRTPPAHARRRRPFSRVARFVLVLFGAAIGFGIVGAGVAFGYWLTSDSSNPAQAGADTLPTGATPSAPATTPNPNSDTVVVSFAQAHTATGHLAIPAANYSLRRYPATGGSAVSVTASCSGTGTITCTEQSVPDGKWQYSDTPTYGTNWVGTESAKSPTVTVDTTPPTVAVTIPAASGVYNARSWNAMAAISGTASDATSGIPGASSINVVITQSSTGETWSGSSFAPGNNSVHPSTYTSGTWTYTFPAGDFSADGNYSVGVSATDAAGNTSAIASSSFTFDNTPPTGSISYTNGYITNTSGYVTFSATDAVSLVNPASGQLERASASLSGGACGVFGPFSAIGPTGASSPFPDSTVTSGSCYQYEYVVSDNAGNQSTITSSSVLRVDTAAPGVPTLAYAGLTNAYASGHTVYYRGAAGSGSFTVTATSADPVSGISTYGFPTLGTGWTATGSGASRTYSWSSANPPIASGPFTATATNGAGLTSSGSNSGNPFTLTVDNTAPAGGSIAANGSLTTSYNTTGTVPLSVTDFTDTGSGMATNTITRASGTLNNNTCGSLAGSTPVTLIGGDDSSTLPTGCYQYTLTGTDNVGNLATATSALVKVDTTAPVNNLTLTNQSGGASYLMGTTVYYQGSAAGSFTITNALTDVGSGPASTTFGGLTGTSTGFTFAGGTVSAPAGGPFVSATISWSANTLSSPTVKITGTDNVGNTAAVTLTFVEDTNTLTQSPPSLNGNSGHTTFQGTSSSATTITLYYCIGTVTSCTASTAVGSISTTGAPSWTTPVVSLAHNQAYTSQAYQTDPDGEQLVSNFEQFNT